jgi:hypothetical protein
MPRTPENLEGRRYGFLLVLSSIPERQKEHYWQCRCDCGRLHAVQASNLRSGRVQSCGCQRSALISKGLAAAVRRGWSPTHVRIHGETNGSVHWAWASMKQRCHNPLCRDYYRYGGRGITVCDRWRDSYPTFRDDMGPKPTGASIERKDNSKGYEPGNCVWATDKEQQNNTRKNRIIECDGSRMTMAQWSDRSGIPQQSIGWRLLHGWDVKDAIFRPIGPTGPSQYKRKKRDAQAAQ